MAQLMNKNSKPVFGKRIGLYSVFVLVAAVSGFIYGARTTGLFACQAPDSGSDQYVGLCNVTDFGDYDHGAFWFGLEPIAVKAATQATVLFVGNSRMQFGLSTGELDGWFRSRELDYYLLGFSQQGNYRFLGPLLQKMRPHAEMYVINVDNFFENMLSGPANSVMNEPESLNRYKQKLYWQIMHERICGASSWLCGNELSFIRKRTNGAWLFKGADFLARAKFGDRPVSYDRSIDQNMLTNYESRAKEFLAAADTEPKCVVLTIIPNSDTSAGTAKALAGRLGLRLVAPEMEGLTTFDGSHLDPASAARWSDVFIQALGPHVEQCLQGLVG
jgi:hypothetical protein